MSNEKKLSNRERLKLANKTSLFDDTKKDNIINEQIRTYQEHIDSASDSGVEDAKDTVVEASVPSIEKEDSTVAKEPEADTTASMDTTVSTDTSKGGRPKKYNEPTRWVKLQIPESDHQLLQFNSGRYGGMTGYLNHLVSLEVERLKNERLKR